MGKPEKYFNLTTLSIDDKGGAVYSHALMIGHMDVLLLQLMQEHKFLINAQELTKKEFEFIFRQLHSASAGGSPN